MYDITSEKTRENIFKWREEANQMIDQYNPENNNNIPFVIIANKMDLLKKNSNNYDNIIKESKDFTDSLKTDFIACSSKIKYDEFNVNIGMTILLKKILLALKNGKLTLPLKSKNTINFDDENESTDGCKC